MNMLETIFGQLPEALYFATFMIYTKKLKSKRVLFISLMVIEYMLLLNIFPFSTWAHILYFVVTYIILKMLYKERAQITDIFTLGIASLVMIVVNIIIYVLFRGISYYIAATIDRVMLFALLFFFKERLPKIQRVYKKLWNRNDKIRKCMKSTTFRCLNLFIFNIMFYIINGFMIYCLFRR